MRSRNFCTFTAQGPKCPRRCLRDKTLTFCTRVLYAPAEPLNEWGFLLVFPPEMWDPLRPEYPKNTKHKYLAKKKRLLTVRQGHVEHVCKVPGSVSKTAWHWSLNEFRAISLKQPVHRKALVAFYVGIWYCRVFMYQVTRKMTTPADKGESSVV